MMLSVLLVLSGQVWKPCEVTVYDNPKRIVWEGRRTASGERFCNRKLTASVHWRHHERFPFGTIVEISRGSRHVRVKINDTGGYRPKSGVVWFDVSGAAMTALLGRWENTKVKARFKIISYPKRKRHRKKL